MIEQPVPVSAGPEALQKVTEAAHPVPVIADESAIEAGDAGSRGVCQRGQRQARQVRWIRRALEMIHTARAHGMLVMLGCMVETRWASRLRPRSPASSTSSTSTARCSSPMIPTRDRSTTTAASCCLRSLASGWSHDDS